MMKVMLLSIFPMNATLNVSDVSHGMTCNIYMYISVLPDTENTYELGDHPDIENTYELDDDDCISFILKYCD